MSRLPSGIKKVELGTRKDGRPKIRYDVLVSTGTINGKRTQVRKRFKTEADARQFQADTLSEVRRGTYVHKTKLTVDQACADWLNSKHAIKPSTLRGYKIWLQPLRDEYGHIEIQKLTKAQLDSLISRLRAGEVDGRKPWTPTSINGLLKLTSAVLTDKLKQGEVVRNVADLVDRLPSEKAEMKTLSEEDMFTVIDYDDKDRHLWMLALCMGLRRGEIAGLRRKFVDLDAQTLEVAETRLAIGSTIITESPKSTRSNRILPIPDELIPVLTDAFGRIESEWVACANDGEPYHPNYITERWGQVLKALNIEYVRLHDARHTCASYLHHKGVPIATISRYLGHSTAAFTMTQYVHAGADALKEATSAFKRV